MRRMMKVEGSRSQDCDDPMFPAERRRSDLVLVLSRAAATTKSMK